MSENPYQAPQTDVSGDPQVSDHEVIRRKHIGAEVSIKSIGLLYWLGAIFSLLSTIGLFATGGTIGGSPEEIGVMIAGLVFPAFMIIVAIAIRRFKRWARIVAGILSAVGLLLFPIGTIINVYFLFLLFGKQSKMVFSPEYQEVIAATPHVKYKTSRVVWILLIVILVLLIGGIAAIVYDAS